MADNILSILFTLCLFVITKNEHIVLIGKEGPGELSYVNQGRQDAGTRCNTARSTLQAGAAGPHVTGRFMYLVL